MHKEWLFDFRKKQRPRPAGLGRFDAYFLYLPPYFFFLF